MKKGDALLVTDSHGGIYFGILSRRLEGGNAIELIDARHCYSYVVEGGVHSGPYALATVGPGPGSLIGPTVTMMVRDVATVTACSDRAHKQWEAATWGTRS